MLLTLIYLAMCILVGTIGRDRKMGFWGYFFASIVLTPVVGLLFVLVSDPTKTQLSQQIDELTKELRDVRSSSKGGNS